MAIDHAAITETTIIIGVTVGLKLSDFELVSRLMHSLKVKKSKTNVCEVTYNEDSKLMICTKN